jgi:hypothetical protein
MQRLSIHRYLTPNRLVIVIASRKVFDSSETGMSFSNAHKVSEVSRIQGFLTQQWLRLVYLTPGGRRSVQQSRTCVLPEPFPTSRRRVGSQPPPVFGAAI